ncbi:MAG TPA: AMP-binding protein [Gammaproteobacteria bacterium]|nr:AMP-binding protein [Gammaproteobacteria bacterium]
MSEPPQPARDPETGFWPGCVYEEVVARYPSVADLVRRKARENGERTWLTATDGRRYSYREVDDLSDRLAAGFAGLGVDRGDHVAIFACNSPEWILAWFALLKLGAAPVTVNTGFVGEPLVYNLVQSDSRFLVADARLLPALERVADRLGGIRHLVTIGPGDTQRLPWPRTPLEELVETRPEPAAQARQRPGDCSAMILTSGTTGRSKVVVETHAQFLITALFMADVGGMDRDSVVYVYLPLFHIMALDLATVAAMLADARMVLAEQFSAGRFWQDIRRYGATHFNAVGPVLEMLLKQPPSAAERRHGPLTAIAYCSRGIWDTARERFDISITGGYGSTEVGIPVSSPRSVSAAGDNAPGSCGRVGPHVELALMDEDGGFVPHGGVGEIVVRPRLPWALFREYYRMPEQTVDAFRGLWFHTGDAGVFDADGVLYFSDRLKDSIRRRGENISSYEIEQILLGHESVQEAAVIPVPSDLGDDEVLAVVVPARKDFSAEALAAWAAGRMPAFWVPRYLRLVDALPRTPTGRVQKYRLRRDGVTPDTFDLG